MKKSRYLVHIALLTITLSVGAQTAPPSRQLGGTDPTAGTVNPTPQSALLRILTPVASQKLTANAITVRFELTTPGATPGTPTFLVQLDGRDPVRTSTTSQTFSGLAPGAHSVTVQLVDANSTPVTGGRATVQFVVASQNGEPAQSPQSVLSKSRKLELAGFTFQQPGADQQSAGDSGLPQSGSPLPLISVIGFGILVGGIVSAMKTRN